MLVSTAMMAQTKIGVQGNYAADEEAFGIGAKLQYGLSADWRLEGAFNYFFKKNYTSSFDIDGTVQYLIPIGGNFTLYPEAGLVYKNWNTDGYHTGKIGANFGIGLEFPIVKNLNLGIEGKYQTISHANQLVLSVGVTWAL